MGPDFVGNRAGTGRAVKKGFAMQALERFRSFLRNLFLLRRVEADLAQELQCHLQLLIDENVRAGMPPEEALRAARLELGGVEQVKEQVRDERIGNWIRSVIADCRYGFRQLRNNPGFTAAAILVLALGIGANTALFSIINGVLLRPLPFPHPEQLMVLRESKPNFATGSVPYVNFLDWQKENRTFAAMSVSRSNRSVMLTGLGGAEQLNVVLLGPGFFELLGVNPALGRTFSADELRISAAPVVMLSAAFWERKFASSREVAGKSIALDGRAFEIVGVVPASFDYLGQFRNVDVYLPIVQWDNPLLMKRGAGLGIGGVGRLRPGVSVEQARTDMDRVSRNLEAAYPDTNKGTGAVLIPLERWMIGGVRSSLFVLFGAVGFVLLIACVNVANLLLARSTRRTQEFAVRTALGAGRSRIVRQLLVESVLLVSLGGSVGLLLAALGTKTALSVLPSALPRAAEIGVDGNVMIFAVLLSLAAGILFGLAPALKAARRDPQQALQEGGRGGSGGRHRLQGALVAAEVSLALVLLVGAGLMIRTLSALQKVNPGFDADKVAVFSFALPPTMSNPSADSVRATFRQVQERFQAAPGVEAVSFSWGALPLAGDDEWLFWVDGQPTPQNDSEMKWAIEYVVGPDYQRLMGISMRSGRFFTEQDDERGARVVVIDEVLAKKFFDGQNPVGKRLHLQSTGDVAEIVGVAAHVNQWGLDSDDRETLRAQLYFPFWQLPDKTMAQSASGIGVVVRSGKPGTVFGSIREVNRQMSAGQVVFGAQTMEEIISSSLQQRRFSMILLGVFAGLAVLLSSVGIYGVVSYIVGQRTHEIGVRVALGAGRADVLRLVLTEGAKMTAAGLAVGLAASFALTRLVTNLLFGVSPTDPLTLAAVVLLLAGVSLLACYIPAWRASTVDPSITLRYE
jgi:predicted permease